eukprot:m.328075 g.328075  ORF g.328075 m.328075 type:complete len:105 (+) comp19751_c0_seq1:121-435(+)
MRESKQAKKKIIQSEPAHKTKKNGGTKVAKMPKNKQQANTQQTQPSQHNQTNKCNQTDKRSQTDEETNKQTTSNKQKTAKNRSFNPQVCAVGSGGDASGLAVIL